MEKGIKLQKQLAMGMKGSEKESDKKKKGYMCGGMHEDAIEKKNLAYGGKAGKKNLKKGGKK